VEQHTQLEEAWGWEQQKLDEIRHRFAHNGGVERMCDIQKAAGGVLEALLAMAAQNGPEGSQAFQEEFQALMQKAGALHAYCASGDGQQFAPEQPGSQQDAGFGGQARPGKGENPSPVTAAPVENVGLGKTGPSCQARLGELGQVQAGASGGPKRARDQPDTDPGLTGSEEDQEAAGAGAFQAAFALTKAKQEGRRLEETDPDGDKAMGDAESSLPSGRSKGRARRAAPKAKLDPVGEGGQVVYPEEGSDVDLQDLVEPMQEDAEDAPRAKGSKKEVRRAAKAAAKAAARQLARTKKHGKK